MDLTPGLYPPDPSVCGPMRSPGRSDHYAPGILRSSGWGRLDFSLIIATWPKEVYLKIVTLASGTFGFEKLYFSRF